jgi:predicted Fe-Mo cluster-binding NifX family protein
MIIGIPVCQEIIAPRFDCAVEFLILEFEGKDIIKSQVLPLAEQNPLRRALFMIQVPVDIIICSRIDNFSYRLLKDHKIKIISEQYGQIEEVLASWLPHLAKD